MEAKQFKSEVRSDSEVDGLPEIAVFSVDLEGAQRIEKLAALVAEHGLKLVEVFDSSARFLKEEGGDEDVHTDLGILRVSSTEFWFAAYLKHTKVMVLTDRQAITTLTEHFGPNMGGVSAELLEPSVQAEAHADDRRLNPKFDAARWFAQASDEDILRLEACGWGGDYPADAVAEHMADHDQGVRQLFEYNEIVQRTGAKDVGGYECRVDPVSAMAWLKVHRGGVWAEIVCGTNEVSLVEAQEEEVRGRWDWLDGHGNASSASFETKHEAARDAVEVLSLEAVPK